MCLIFIGLKKHPEYKLVVAANRDEFYNRKTATANYWDDHPQIVGGRDLEAGGSWLSMNINGKISMITNFRDPKNINDDAPSRGHLVSDYLLQNIDPKNYLQKLTPYAHRYNGFNLLVGNTDALHYFSNYSKGITDLTEGAYAISNHLLETPWPKIERGKKKFEIALSDQHLTEVKLFELLYDDTIAPDHSLPDTGVGLQRERILSSMFIKSPGYGTRCSTVIMVDNANNVLFSERVYDVNTFQYTINSFRFAIE